MDKKIENISFRKAEIEDIAVLCELLWELFSQEVEFTPNKETQEKALKKIIEDESKNREEPGHRLWVAGSLKAE